MTEHGWPHDGGDAGGAREPVRLALRGWQQRVHAVIEIARDSDDLAARLPVLDQIASELVADLRRALSGLHAARDGGAGRLPPGTDVLRDALHRAHARLEHIDLWHRGPAVAALRTARDHFAVAAERLDT